MSRWFSLLLCLTAFALMGTTVSALAPTASLEYTPKDPTVDDIIYFDGKESTAGSGSQREFRFVSDDDNWDTGWQYEGYARHKFDKTGTYEVTLWVKNENGEQDDKSIMVEVSEEGEDTIFGLPILMWIIIIVAAGAVLAIIVVATRRRKTPDWGGDDQYDQQYDGHGYDEAEDHHGHDQHAHHGHEHHDHAHHPHGHYVSHGHEHHDHGHEAHEEPPYQEEPQYGEEQDQPHDTSGMDYLPSASKPPVEEPPAQETHVQPEAVSPPPAQPVQQAPPAQPVQPVQQAPAATAPPAEPEVPPGAKVASVQCPNCGNIMSVTYTSTPFLMNCGRCGMRGEIDPEA